MQDFACLCEHVRLQVSADIDADDFGAARAVDQYRRAGRSAAGIACVQDQSTGVGEVAGNDAAALAEARTAYRTRRAERQPPVSKVAVIADLVDRTLTFAR